MGKYFNTKSTKKTNETKEEVKAKPKTDYMMYKESYKEIFGVTLLLTRANFKKLTAAFKEFMGEYDINLLIEFAKRYRDLGYGGTGGISVSLFTNEKCTWVVENVQCGIPKGGKVIDHVLENQISFFD